MTTLAGEIEWIGHADYADNAVVARNLVAGRGYSVDYVMQFYRDYPPTIRHPADVWPLLQPTLIALAFWVAGVSTFAAKLPNIVAMIGLLAGTAWLGDRLCGRPAGLLAAAGLALHPWFFQNALFPVNDVPFSLLFLLAVGLIDVLDGPEAKAWTIRRATAGYALLGLLGGLLVLCKPSGLLLLAGLAAWWLWRRRPGTGRGRPDWRGPQAAVLVAGILVAPLVGRNLLTFGTPFYSLQAFDAWVIKWEPFENIYRLWPDGPPRAGRLLSFGVDRIAGAVVQEFVKFGRDLAAGNFVEWPLLLAAALAPVVGGGRVRRPLGALLAATLPYGLFVQVYWHYELRYYAFLIPWLAILATGAVLALVRRGWRSGPAAAAGLAGALALVVLLPLAPPRLDALAAATARLTPPAGDVVVGEWLAANTPPEAVVMTRVPWQISWHSERRAVMIPLAPAEEILAVARRYGVGYLVADRPNDASIRRPALAPLYAGRETLGFAKLKEFRNDRGDLFAVVYRLPP
jgi:4-amino-4-deoxy-L-arabinose transferase-like glycosyltransferase